MVSPSFLEYMNEALRRLRAGGKGHANLRLHVSHRLRRSHLAGFSCRSRQAGAGRRGSGHGVIFPTIRRDVDLAMLDEETERRFDLDGSYPYSRHAARATRRAQTTRGRFSGGGPSSSPKVSCSHPSRSLVSNIGFDGSGTHYNKSARAGLSKELNLYCGQLRMPDEVFADTVRSNSPEYYCASPPPKPKRARAEAGGKAHWDPRGDPLPDETCEIPPPYARSVGYMGALRKIKSMFGKSEPDISSKKVKKQKQKKEKAAASPGTTADNQDLNVYWEPKMADLLEKWGEGNAWHEIDFLMVNCHGKVLDIACGTGKNMMQLAKFTQLEVHGCDISDFLIQKAKDRGLHADKLRVADATKTDYADNEFNYSYSIGSIEHFTEEGIADLVAEAHRITRKASFHMLPVSKSGKDEGWVKTYQSAFNNSVEWWLAEMFISHTRRFMCSILFGTIPNRLGSGLSASKKFSSCSLGLENRPSPLPRLRLSQKRLRNQHGLRQSESIPKLKARSLSAPKRASLRLARIASSTASWLRRDRR